jgi:hypothetical protein
MMHVPADVSAYAPALICRHALSPFLVGPQLLTRL